MEALMTTAAELRAAVLQAKAGWTVDHRFKDGDAVPIYKTGGDPAKFSKAADVPRIDIASYLAIPTSNLFLLQLRASRGLLKTALPQELQSRVAPEALTAPKISSLAVAPAGTAAPAMGGGTSASVDWRSRFGWPWLTNIKDQGGCESCWVFSAVGAVEAMTRIEHAIWSLRSEGDVHDGMGAQCATTGDPANALNWMKQHGVADPGCWSYEQNNEAYKPTPDRNGRTVRLANYVSLGNVQDQKNWIDNIGPLSACFDCYDDFFGYGPNSGVYRRASNTLAGGHCIVIVGYDDARQAWLVRNSWGTSWGMAGYCWFGYGQCNMDNYTKYGVPSTNTNPDPWTKRRAHNGSLYESGDGALARNFEFWSVAPNHAIRHYWRDGSSLEWALAETLGNDCAASPTVTGTTYDRNFEYVYPTTGNRLHHRYFDQATQKWGDGGVFGPSNVAGIPAFLQSDYGAPGNFEVVVRLSNGTLEHWWRNDGAGMVWAASATFGANIKLSAPTMVQLRAPNRGLDLVCVTTSGEMQRYWRDDAHGGVWHAAETFGAGIDSPPVMIEGQYGAANETKQGNYELCVAHNGVIQHWWRENGGSGRWSTSTTFGSNVAQVLGLIEGSFGFNLELVALLKDGSLQHYWRESGGAEAWHAGPVFGSTTH
jgi:C1A family cysteine protease